MSDMILQADPKAAYLAQRDEIDAAIARVLASGWYVLGEEVAAFEREFAAFQETAHGIGVGSGTAALSLALRALGVGPGDGVATVAHTAVATVAAIELIGAVPLLVDIDRGYAMDPGSLEALLQAPPVPVKAVVPVHIYGQPADMETILPLARRHGLAVLEDCAQSHGARLGGRPAGTFGDAAAYSFYPTKNLGALGDGGFVATADAATAERVRSLRAYGWRQVRYVSEEPGDNSRLDELQAAILRVKLRRLAADTERRRAIASAYDAALADGPLPPPWRRPGAAHAFHLYVVETGERDALAAALKGAGIGTNVHYPVPVHLQPAYAGRIALAPGGLPATERAAGRVLSLPLFPQMSDAQVERVAAALRRAGS